MVASSRSSDFILGEKVPVIVTFDTKGNLKPLFVRIDNFSLKVVSYMPLQTFSRNISEFECEVADGFRRIPIQLSYCKDENLWFARMIKKA